jgi:hypothetical protein
MFEFFMFGSNAPKAVSINSSVEDLTTAIRLDVRGVAVVEPGRDGGS